MSLGDFASGALSTPSGGNAFAPELPSQSLAPEDAADWHLIDDQIRLSLLELDHIQGYRHHPTLSVELIGDAIFLPLSQSYAPKDVRLDHVLSRIGQIPRLLDQVKEYLSDADPILVKTAIQENEGNIDLIQNTVCRRNQSRLAVESRIRPRCSRRHRRAEKFQSMARRRFRNASQA